MSLENMKTKEKEIVNLTNILNVSANEYYNGKEPSLSDVEYDNLLDKLSQLEEETGIQLPNSPTKRVGFIVLDSIPKKRLDKVMLSLDKIKNDCTALVKWIKGRLCILMLKLDGLSCQLKYEDGNFVSACTRGNGVEGSDVTDMVKTLSTVPNFIEGYNGLVIGEIIIRKHNFNLINEIRRANGQDEFANIRNLATGTLLSLDTKLGKERHLEFMAFDMTGYSYDNVTQEDILWDLNHLGFQTPSYDIAGGFEDELAVKAYIESLKTQADEDGLPIDGIVIGLNDLEQRARCKSTDKYPTHSVAFKFEDEYEITNITNIEESMSRNGILTPIAVFDTVILDGTEVSRASLHNISILRAHEIGIGDEIKVVKANQIIPQITENLTRSDSYELPTHCPYCESELLLEESVEGVLTLRCTNTDRCSEQQVLKMVHMLSKEALNAKGVSEKIIRKLISFGEIENIFDLLDLPSKREKLIKASYPSFGRKSVNNICDAIESSCKTTLDRFLIGLGIDGVGKKVAKDITKKYTTIHDLLNVTESGLRAIEGIDSTAKDICSDIINSKQYICDLMKYIAIEVPQEKTQDGNTLEGKTFVFTGKTKEFKNRKEVEEFIVNNGGKMSGSVSSKTSYLICNTEDSSSKYNKAKELGTPIITESELIAMVK